MPTAKQIAKQRARIRKDAEIASRIRDRESLRRVRERLLHARRLSGQRFREIVITCKTARHAIAERAKVIRADYRARAAELVNAERMQARRDCNAAKTRARASGGNSVERASRALDLERKHQELLRRYSKPARLTRAEPALRRMAERIAESDSEVEGNIPPELVPVFRAVRTKIKGTARRSRSEAFLEWAAEHRAEVMRIVDRQVEADVDELVRHEATLRKRVASSRAYRRMSDHELSGVPF